MVLLYSARLSRRIVTRPGSASRQSAFDLVSTQSTMRWRARSLGCGLPAGGIVFWPSRPATFPHVSSVFPKSTDRAAAARSRPAEASEPEWHPRQYLATTGLTSFAKLGTVGFAAAAWPWPALC